MKWMQEKEGFANIYICDTYMRSRNPKYYNQKKTFDM